jgi:predicted metal-dependent HD superfamily phosphohydrolase
MSMLQSSWSRSWQALGASGDGDALMKKLVGAYEEPHRQYHTLQHLTECISLLERHLHLAVNPGEVEIALWFHDAVYDVKGEENEAASAVWAEEALRAAGVPASSLERVSKLIMATCHAAPPEGPDEQLLVDVDLSILGAPGPRFVEYEAQVRAEYQWVPAQLFCERRRAILTEFLARQSIYHTPQIRDVLEAQARANLAYALKQLGANNSSQGNVPDGPRPKLEC